MENFSRFPCRHLDITRALHQMCIHSPKKKHMQKDIIGEIRTLVNFNLKPLNYRITSGILMMIFSKRHWRVARARKIFVSRAWSLDFIADPTLLCHEDASNVATKP